jgi:hypothetical protein
MKDSGKIRQIQQAMVMEKKTAHKSNKREERVQLISWNEQNKMLTDGEKWKQITICATNKKVNNVNKDKRQNMKVRNRVSDEIQIWH